jgi:hypothetical protein
LENPLQKANPADYWTRERIDRLLKLVDSSKREYLGKGGPNSNYTPAWHFCRGLKGFPAFVDLSATQAYALLGCLRVIKPPPSSIWEMLFADCDDPVQEFLETWDKVLFAEGERLLPKILQRLQKWPYKLRPPVSAKFENAMGFCGHLYEIRPDRPFYLSCRTLGEAIGVSHIQAAKYLRWGQLRNILQLVSTGRTSREAYEYSFREDRFINREEQEFTLPGAGR